METAMAAERKQQPDQQRRQEHPENIRGRGGADRGRDIAAGHRGEGDGGLHRRRQHAEEEDAGIKRRRQHARHQQADREAKQRKQHERGGEDGDVQAPVQEAGHHHVARQARAMQEEQKRDRQLGRHAEIAGKRALRRQQRGEDDGADEQQGKCIGQETAHGIVSQ